MSATTPNRCTFCRDRKPRVVMHAGQQQVQCSNDRCQARGPLAPFKTLAVQAWNYANREA